MVVNVVKISLLTRFDVPTLNVFCHQDSIVIEKGDVMCEEPVDIRNMPTNQCTKVPTNSVLGIKFMIDLIVFGDDAQPADFFLDQ